MYKVNQRRIYRKKLENNRDVLYQSSVHCFIGSMLELSIREHLFSI